MKTRTILLIAMCTMMTGAYAQEPSITLTFNAQHQSESITLDSNFIQNLTQGGDTMLYWPEQTLMIEITAGFLNIDMALVLLVHAEHKFFVGNVNFFEFPHTCCIFTSLLHLSFSFNS
jgi:hypothetical protein